MRRFHDILTPENVNIRYELAGLGSRFAAVLIDSLIQGALTIAVVIAMVILGFDFEGGNYGTVFFALGIIALFLIMSGYFIFFEMIMEGQTPGKLAVGLKVAKFNGEPLTFIDSLIRNVIRIADMLPAFYLLGSAFILFSAGYRRIGDFAANTVVVKVRRDYKSVPAAPELFAPAPDVGGEPVKNRFPVSNQEYEVLREFLARQEELGGRKKVFIYHLNGYFVSKFGLKEPPYEDPVQFFETIVRMNAQ